MAYEFKLLLDSSLDNLTVKINEKLDAGWALHGGIDLYTFTSNLFVQCVKRNVTMSKREKMIYEKLPMKLRDDIETESCRTPAGAKKWLFRCLEWMDSPEGQLNIDRMDVFKLTNLCYRRYFDVLDGTH